MKIYNKILFIVSILFIFVTNVSADVAPPFRQEIDNAPSFLTGLIIGLVLGISTSILINYFKTKRKK